MSGPIWSAWRVPPEKYIYSKAVNSGKPQSFILAAMSFDSIRLITFDCYGTLIDWESGMLAALRPLFSHDGRKVADAQILELYGEIEAELESGPYLPYREILSKTAQEIGRRLNTEVSVEEARGFASSLTRWKPFMDTVATLHSL